MLTTPRRGTLAIAALRTHLGDTLNRVTYTGERVMVTRNGKPAAALISADDLEYFEELEDAADAAALDEARRTDDGQRISYHEFKRQLDK